VTRCLAIALATVHVGAVAAFASFVAWVAAVPPENATGDARRDLWLFAAGAAIFCAAFAMFVMVSLGRWRWAAFWLVVEGGLGVAILVSLMRETEGSDHSLILVALAIETPA
jgi:hypothetical protein